MDASTRQHMRFIPCYAAAPMSRVLPPTPKVELEVVRDKTNPDDAGFLRVKRFDLVTRTADGKTSKPFPYDVLDRRALDACVMVAHHVENGAVHVWMRSAIRPPLALRTQEPLASGGLWELPAGLVEPGESPRAAAARELDEELGFHVEEEALVPLGEWTVPAPGFVGEMHWFFHVEVDPSARKEPGGDGSPLEDGALVVAAPLAKLLDACRSGEIRDAKTELALRRLAEMVR